MKARSGVEHQFSAGIAEIRNAAESGNGFMAQVMKQFQAPVVMGAIFNESNGLPQTTNLGVGGSNPSGRAISLFRFNTRALSQCACAHSVPISVPIRPFPVVRRARCPAESRMLAFEWAQSINSDSCLEWSLSEA